MNVNTVNGNGYSADVRMHLTVAGRTIQIRQIGPDFIMVDNSVELLPSQGEITMSIDGRVKQWQVALPDGISSDRIRTKVGRIA